MPTRRLLKDDVKLQQANSKFEHAKGGTSFTLRQTQVDGEDVMLTIVRRCEEVMRAERAAEAEAAKKASIRAAKKEEDLREKEAKKAAKDEAKRLAKDEKKAA